MATLILTGTKQLEADEEEPEERTEMDDSETNGGEDQSSDEVAADESDDDDPPPVDSEDDVETAMAPPYHVEEVADLSYAGVVRTEASVVTEQEVRELDQEELRLIAEEVVEEITDEEDVNAIVVFFYDPGADIEFAAEAKFEWALNGNWEDAGDVDTGDYTTHEYHFERFTEQVERTELEEQLNARSGPPDAS